MLDYCVLEDNKTQRAANNQPLYMYVVRVLLGNAYICKTPQKFKRPPCADPTCNAQDACTTHNIFFDSVIGTHRPANVGGGRLMYREFVVYKPDQCYPEYLVEYVRQ